MEAINCLKHKLQRLSLPFQPSVPPEPLDEVLQQYTEPMFGPKADHFCKYLNPGYTHLQWK